MILSFLAMCKHGDFNALAGKCKGCSTDAGENWLMVSTPLFHIVLPVLQCVPLQDLYSIGARRC